MAPRAKTKQAAKAKAKALPAGPSLTATDAINAQVQSKLAACDAAIKNFWHDLVDGKSTSASGHQPYNEKQAAAALGSRMPYVCSCPFYWLNLTFDFQPNLPKYPRRIDALEKHFFSSPANMTEPILVYVNPGELPHTMKGSLKTFCPPELRDAMRQAVANAIDQKSSKKVLEDWRNILLSVPIRFEVGGTFILLCLSEVMDEQNRLEVAFRTIVQRREDLVVKKDNMTVPRSDKANNLKKQI